MEADCLLQVAPCSGFRTSNHHTWCPLSWKDCLSQSTNISKNIFFLLPICWGLVSPDMYPREAWQILQLSRLHVASCTNSDLRHQYWWRWYTGWTIQPFTLLLSVSCQACVHLFPTEKQVIDVSIPVSWSQVFPIVRSTDNSYRDTVLKLRTRSWATKQKTVIRKLVMINTLYKKQNWFIVWKKFAIKSSKILYSACAVRKEQAAEGIVAYANQFKKPQADSKNLKSRKRFSSCRACGPR